MFYIYVIYSASADRFYVGHSNDPHRRLQQHNESPFDTYTSKHRPWELKAMFECGFNRAEAMKFEKLIKGHKSRRLLVQLCDSTFTPFGDLAQLVRVPHVRDAR